MSQLQPISLDHRNLHQLPLPRGFPLGRWIFLITFVITTSPWGGGEYIAAGIIIIRAAFFLFGVRLVKYFHFIILGLLESLKIMASSSASSLTNSLKIGELCVIWTCWFTYCTMFSSIPLPGLFQRLYLKSSLLLNYLCSLPLFLLKTNLIEQLGISVTQSHH